MSFLLSQCVGLVTADTAEAAQYYMDFFGMEPEEVELIVALTAGPLTLFIDPGHCRPPVFELVTPDLDIAREIVAHFEFQEIVWRGAGQSCLVRDPFGIVFNIHEDRSLFLPQGLEEPRQSFIKPSIGAFLPEPQVAASFYSQLLESADYRLPDGSYAIDSGSMRLRFKQGDHTTPVIWVKSSAPVAKLVKSGCKSGPEGIFVDPYGVSWIREIPVKAKKAVCNPL